MRVADSQSNDRLVIHNDPDIPLVVKSIEIYIT